MKGYREIKTSSDPIVLMIKKEVSAHIVVIKIKELNDHIVVGVTKMKEASDLIVAINMKGANGRSVDPTKILTSLVEEKAIYLVTKSLSSTVMILTCQDPLEEETSKDRVTTITVTISYLADKIEVGMRDHSILANIL